MFLMGLFFGLGGKWLCDLATVKGELKYEYKYIYTMAMFIILYFWWRGREMVIGLC